MMVEYESLYSIATKALDSQIEENSGLKAECKRLKGLLMYKDKDKQREANKVASRRYRDKQGMTQVGANVIPAVIPNTKVFIKNLTGAEAKAILDEWVDGESTRHQQHLAILGRHYAYTAG